MFLFFLNSVSFLFAAAVFQDAFRKQTSGGNVRVAY